MHKEQCNNKFCNDVKSSAYKETERVRYAKNVGNTRHDEFGSKFTFKAKSYIKTRNNEDNIQDNIIVKRKKEEVKKMQTREFIPLENLNWRIKNQLITTIVIIRDQISTIHIAFSSTKRRVVKNVQQNVRVTYARINTNYS